MPNICDFVLFQNVMSDAEQHLAVDKAISEDVTVDTKRLATDLLSYCHRVPLLLHSTCIAVLTAARKANDVRRTHWQTISTDQSETGILFLSLDPSTFVAR